MTNALVVTLKIMKKEYLKTFHGILYGTSNIFMFDRLKIKILKAGSKRTVQFCQIVIKNVFLNHLSQVHPTIADKTKEKKYLSTFLGDTLYITYYTSAVHSRRLCIEGAIMDCELKEL